MDVSSLSSASANSNIPITPVAKPKEILAKWCSENNFYPLFKYSGRVLYYVIKLRIVSLILCRLLIVFKYLSS